MNAKKNVTKVTAYITRVKDKKIQLLTMVEEGMESYGLQVPGGTLELGEKLEECLLREVYEEAELKEVKIQSYLGEHTYFLAKKNAEITRHYFHVTVEECMDKFTVVVRSQDEDNGWVYHYTWVTLDKTTIPELGGHLGFGLEKLYDSIFL
ncbi:NUDIX domain-containing protein [Bacillus alkalicellulosilyticus]|uniref:NUDIX domain-containing protein n=1 Tax=Alkalihalobacterium alkalicellulosilyticum TaxID=1912214 RepID=UPI0014820A2D|nr:NUDIX hydrolase [Bacillus alkalicellulosilyticus]